jgi:hypothetical protein
MFKPRTLESFLMRLDVDWFKKRGDRKECIKDRPVALELVLAT